MEEDVHRLIATLWCVCIVLDSDSAYAHASKDDSPAPSNITEAESAYQYLEILPAQWAGRGTPSEQNGEQDCRTYDSAHIRGLLPEMAIRVARMARAYEAEEDIPLMVLSAYRSPADQECVCKNVPKHCAGWRSIPAGKDTEGKPIYTMIKTGGVSRHQHRIAIDMRPAYADPGDDKALDAAYRYFHAWLKKNQVRFGLCHPVFHIGDRAHIELMHHRHHARSVRHAKTKKHKKRKHKK